MLLSVSAKSNAIMAVSSLMVLAGNICNVGFAEYRMSPVEKSVIMQDCPVKAGAGMGEGVAVGAGVFVGAGVGSTVGCGVGVAVLSAEVCPGRNVNKDEKVLCGNSARQT